MGKKNNHRCLTLPEIAKGCGISYQTLNYYTCLGLLDPQSRQGNKRLYRAAETKKRLRMIDRLKNEGYPLRMISDIMKKETRKPYYAARP